MPKSIPPNAAAANAKEALRIKAVAFGKRLAGKIFAKRGNNTEVHLQPAELAAAIATGFEIGFETAAGRPASPVDELAVEALARRLFRAWWGRRGRIHFEDQDTESWFAVARAARKLAARNA